MVKLERKDTPIGRFYVNLEHDYIFPSVTSVLGFVKKPVPPSIQVLGKKAALRGTVMHTYLENYVNAFKATRDHEKCLLYSEKKTVQDIGNDYERETLYEGRNLFLNFMNRNFFASIEPLFSEKFIYSAKHGFAGTIDFVYKDINSNTLVIADFKSASSKRTQETIEGYGLQLAAYSLAFFEIFGQNVDFCKILVSYGEELEVFEFPFSKVQEQQKQFLEICDLFYRLNYNKESIRKYII